MFFNIKFNKKKIIVIFILLNIFLLTNILFYIFFNKNKNIENTQFLMNTYITIKLYGKNIKNLKKKQIEIFNHFKLIDQLSTRYNNNNNNNNIYWINNNSGKYLLVNHHLTKQIDLSLHYMKLSDGLFNVSLGNLINLWKQKEKENILPTKKEIKKALASSDLNKIKLNLNNNTIFIPKDMNIDLGSIAKGYAIESVAELIKIDSQITGALINGGGNIKTLGKPNKKSYYKIGIQDPFEKNILIGTTILKNNQSISTSGDCHRYYVINNKKYSHILSPKTGFPIKENYSVSIITQSALHSDILSTILYLMPQKKGEAFLKILPFKAEALWVTINKKIIKTKNFPFIFNNQEKKYKYK